MKRLLSSLIVLLAFSVLSTGCYHNTIVTSPDYDPGMAVVDHTQTRLHLLRLVPLGGAINLNAICPDGVGVVETRYFLPLFFVDISQARVHCVPGNRAMNEEGVETQLTASN